MRSLEQVISRIIPFALLSTPSKAVRANYTAAGHGVAEMDDGGSAEGFVN
jgi:hypothetical protein